MRHQAEDVGALADHAGDVAHAAVRILPRSVTESDSTLRLQAVQLIVGGEVAAAHVLDRDGETISRRELAAEYTVEVLGHQADLAADEAKALVRQKCAGQKPRLAEHLEAVADAEHRAAFGGEAADCLHRGREAGDRSGAQVVAVGEPAGDDHAIEVREVGLLVPDQPALADTLDRLERIPLVAGAGELDHADHAGSVPLPETPSSTTIS